MGLHIAVVITLATGRMPGLLHLLSLPNILPEETPSDILAVDPVEIVLGERMMDMEVLPL
jgi:hypothetical protein